MAGPIKETVSTKGRILEAAHKVFLAKGFATATVRDVAKEARANVASVNYYFQSKENLFNEVMLEKLQHLLGSVAPIVNDKTTSLNQKIDALVDSYIDFLLANPELLAFAMNEIRMRNFEFPSKVPLGKVVFQSHFFKQLSAQCRGTNPVQLFISLLGMMAFPVVAKPMMVKMGLVKKNEFIKMMQERKKLIPTWIKAMMNHSEL